MITKRLFLWEILFICYLCIIVIEVEVLFDYEIVAIKCKVIVFRCKRINLLKSYLRLPFRFFDLMRKLKCDHISQENPYGEQTFHDEDFIIRRSDDLQGKSSSKTFVIIEGY